MEIMPHGVVAENEQYEKTTQTRLEAFAALNNNNLVGLFLMSLERKGSVGQIDKVTTYSADNKPTSTQHFAH